MVVLGCLQRPPVAILKVFRLKLYLLIGSWPIFKKAAEIYHAIIDLHNYYKINKKLKI